MGKATTESKSRVLLSLTRPRDGKTGFGKTGAGMMVVGDSFSSGSTAPVSTTIVSAPINAEEQLEQVQAKGRSHGTFLSRRDRCCRTDIPFLLSPQFYSSWTDDEKQRDHARVRFQSLSRRRYHSGQNHPIVVLLSAKRTFQNEWNMHDWQ